MILIKFLVLIRGALTPPPSIEAPVTKIPLHEMSTNMVYKNGIDYAPTSTQYTQPDTKTNSNCSPHEWTCLLQELADIESLSRAWSDGLYGEFLRILGYLPVKRIYRAITMTTKDGRP